MSLSPSDAIIPKENNLETPEEIKYPLSRPIRYIIFGLYIILNVLMNVDHGTIPAATSEIKIDLVINDEIFRVIRFSCFRWSNYRLSYHFDINKFFQSKIFINYFFNSQRCLSLHFHSHDK